MMNLNVVTLILNFCFLIAVMATVEMKCWDILEVMSMNGCDKACAVSVHHLLPGEVAFYHKNFTARSLQVDHDCLYMLHTVDNLAINRYVLLSFTTRHRGCGY